MVKVGGVFVCLLIVAMDIVAGILGIEAELEQNKVRVYSRLAGSSYLSNVLFVHV